MMSFSSSGRRRSLAMGGGGSGLLAMGTQPMAAARANGSQAATDAMMAPLAELDSPLWGAILTGRRAIRRHRSLVFSLFFLLGTRRRRGARARRRALHGAFQSHRITEPLASSIHNRHVRGAAGAWRGPASPALQSQNAISCACPRHLRSVLRVAFDGAETKQIIQINGHCAASSLCATV